MSFVLDLQAKNVREARDGIEPLPRSYLSQGPCISLVSFAFCP